MKRLKILHVNFSDIRGGAAIAARRLHLALLKNGVNSKMIVCENINKDMNIIGPSNKYNKLLNLFRPILDQIPLRRYKRRSDTMFSPAWVMGRSLVKAINKDAPDIVHLHWVNNGMLSIKDISEINAPIIWTLHDMWPFTGGCHYDEHCGLFTSTCGNCKVLRSRHNIDLSHKNLQKKKKSYSKVDQLHVVGLSKWISDEAKKSVLFSNRNVTNLPNTINTNIFKPLDRKYCRDVLNLRKDKKYILFGAMSSTSDPRKGFEQIVQALHYIKDPSIEFLIFGNASDNFPDSRNTLHYLGQKYDDETLSVLYNAADVVVVPSLQENFSNVILESLSCGSPVVAFDIGGNADMVHHLINGYLAKPFDVRDLSEGMMWTLLDENLSELSKNARSCVLDNYDEKIIAGKYIELYKSILK